MDCIEKTGAEAVRIKWYAIISPTALTERKFYPYKNGYSDQICCNLASQNTEQKWRQNLSAQADLIKSWI